MEVSRRRQKDADDILSAPCAEDKSSTRPKVRDLPYRMAEVLQTLEDAEQRSQLDIIDDVATSSADVIRPRLPGAQHSGEISIERGRLVYEQARNLMLAAACAAVEKRALYAKRKPEQAMQFLEHARFGLPKSTVATFKRSSRP